MTNRYKLIIIIQLIFLFLLPRQAGAQRIKAEMPMVDLGQVEYFLPASVSFDLKNVGRRPLSIYRVDTSCGCTTAYYPTEPIPAGASFTIRVVYDARTMGHFNKLIDVYSNGSDEPLSLELRGQVVEEVEDYIGNFPFQLGELTADCNTIEFDDVSYSEGGGLLQQRFHIYNPTSLTVTPQVMHLPPFLKAEVSPSRVTPGHSAEATIILDTRLIDDYGLQSTNIYLGANPGERVSRDKQINVSFTLLPAKQTLTESLRDYYPAIQLSSEEVALPIHDGKKRSAVIDVKNIGKTDLEILNMQILGEGINVSLASTVIQPSQTTKLKITTEPKRIRDSSSHPRLLMITNDPERPKVIIEVLTGQ